MNKHLGALIKKQKNYACCIGKKMRKDVIEDSIIAFIHASYLQDYKNA